MIKYLVTIALLLSSLLGAFLLINANLNPNVPYTHSSTKALCDSENYCEDYEFFCKNKEVVSIRFTGAAIQFPENWKDPRTKEQKSLC
jgi:hypothetical protein